MFKTDPALWPNGHAPAPAFCGEDERLSVLAAYGLDALQDDPELGRIAAFAARLCDAPIALVSIVEEERQRFLARTGLEVTETPRPTSFCAHAMLLPQTMEVPDARGDPRFADNPLVTGAPHIRFYAGTPLISIEGAPLGALCVIDVTPRPHGLNAVQREGLEVLGTAVRRRLLQLRQDMAATRAIQRRETQLRRMIDSVPGIAWSAAPDGVFDYFNARWRETTGGEPPRLADDWVAFVHEDEFPAVLAHWRQCVADIVPFESQWRLRARDGSYRWMLSRAEPVMEDQGGARWFGTLIDIDDAHREAETRDLLAAELSHRIKNIFAVISGLIAIRSRGHSDVAGFAQELNAVIKSLNLAHDYVRPVEGRKSDSLPGLLADLLAPYDTAAAGRVSVSGDDMAIGAVAATPLALIFHELATNSAKYGALAGDEGQVSVKVRTAQDTVRIEWRERGRPDAQQPLTDETHEGFGSRLLRMSVEGQLGGQFDRRFTADGLEVDFAIPLQRITG